MRIICVDLQKNKLSPWEAHRHLGEVKQAMGKEHAKEVAKKIYEKMLENLEEEDNPL